MSAERTHALRFYGVVALAVTAVVVALALRQPSKSQRPFPESDRPVGEIATWCPETFTPIVGGCFAPAGRAAGPSRGLLVYLHGRYAPESANEEAERQKRVARLGAARGYAVLALRGTQGDCSDPQLATWWCWPSNEAKLAEGPGAAARLAPAIAEAERRAGKGRRLLLGFSNGGYFAAMIAPRALLPFDAIAIAHAGPVEPMRPVGATPPLLLIDADDDPSGPEMDRLENELSKDGWPHAMVAREGGHALPDWDVEMALTFFDRTRAEHLPLAPPLSPRARRLHPPPEVAAASGAATATATSGAASAPTAVPSPPRDDRPAPTGVAEPAAPETPAAPSEPETPPTPRAPKAPAAPSEPETP